MIDFMFDTTLHQAFVRVLLVSDQPRWLNSWSAGEQNCSQVGEGSRGARLTGARPGSTRSLLLEARTGH